MSDAIRELVEAMTEKSKEHIVASVRLAIVKSVDWDKKIMTAVGISDELEYYDVLLGLGSVQLKPKLNTLCLIGIIENKEAETFIIHAEEVEEVSIKSLKVTFNDGLNKGLVVLDSLVSKINRIEEKHNLLVSKFNAHIHLTTATVDATGIPGVISPTATQSSDYATPVTNASEIENDKIKH